jgi:CubicO group peptidase (beta-lactamase class C family)
VLHCLHRSSPLPLLLALALLAGCASPSAAPPRKVTATATPDPATARLDAYFTSLLAAHQFSGSVLIVRGGSVLLRKGYGDADLARQIPNAPETRFRIASLTKQFTAAAILLLQAQGKLHVGDPICRYLPICPPAWQSISMRQVLIHTSGIPNLADSDIADYSQPLTPRHLLALIAAKPLDFVPGTRFAYSNAGYNVLGNIIEDVSGEPYAAFLQDHIFGPLHLNATSYDVNHPPLPQHATGYTQWGAVADYFDISLPYAAGGLASTVDDLYRWSQALDAGALLPRTALDDMLTPHVALCPTPGHGCPPGETQEGYGYGYYIGTEPFGVVQYHLGDLLGYRSLLARYPAQGLTVVVLSNLETADPQAIRSGVERILFSAG